MGLLNRFQHALDEAGAGKRERAGEVAVAEKEAHWTWEVVMGSSRLFARLKARPNGSRQSEAAAMVVAEEADVAKPGEDLVTSSFFRKTGLLLWRVK